MLLASHQGWQLCLARLTKHCNVQELLPPTVITIMVAIETAVFFSFCTLLDCALLSCRGRPRQKAAQGCGSEVARDMVLMQRISAHTVAMHLRCAVVRGGLGHAVDVPKRGRHRAGNDRRYPCSIQRVVYHRGDSASGQSWCSMATGFQL